MKELSAAYDEWIATMADPITGGDKRKVGTGSTVPAAEEKALTEREMKRERIRAEKKAQRDAEKKAAKEKEASLDLKQA